MADHTELGKKAEDMAAEYLKKEGYRILCRNFYHQKAEIDIVAQKNDVLVIVEVKARTSPAFLLPIEAVTKKKIRLLVQAADHYATEQAIAAEIRFDIVSITFPPNKEPVLEHLPDAFSAWDV